MLESTLSVTIKNPKPKPILSYNILAIVGDHNQDTILSTFLEGSGWLRWNSHSYR